MSTRIIKVGRQFFRIVNVPDDVSDEDLRIGILTLLERKIMPAS